MKKIIIYLAVMFGPCAAICQPALSAAEQEGTEFYKAHKSKEAIASFEKAYTENPKSLYSINALSNLYYISYDYHNAYDMADKGSKITNGAANFIAAKAKAAIKLNHAQEAVTILDQYIAKQQPDFMMLFIKGNAESALGDLQQAIAMYSQSIAANADFPDAYLERGKAFGGIERYPQALKDYDKYISLVDDDGDAYNYRGMIYYNTQKNEEAIADYTKAIALDQKNIYALNNRGVAYRDAGQTDKALTDFFAAMAININFADPYFEMALMYDRQKNNANALTMINNAVMLQPQSSKFLGEQGKILLQADKAADAITAADKAITLDPKNPDGYLWKTSAYYNLENYDEAMKSINAGIAILPDDYLFYTLRAAVYRAKGQSALADADDQKAKALSTK